MAWNIELAPAAKRELDKLYPQSALNRPEAICYTDLNEENDMIHTSAPFAFAFQLPVLLQGLLVMLVLVMIFLGASARAADGPYIGIGGGLSLVEDSDVKASARDLYLPLKIKSEIDTGFAVKGTAGYAFASGLRVEAEIGYRENDTDRMTVKSPGTLVTLATPGVVAAINAASPGAYPDTTTYAGLTDAHKILAQNAVKGKTPIKGDISALAFMLNIFYDFDLKSAWKPYIGGGLGFSSESIDVESKATGNSLADDDDTVFIYQVGAGIGYEFTRPQDRSLTASLDWRYFSADDTTYKGSVTGAKFDTEIDGHYVGVGLRYGF